jgi:very-short-patch-repair endonuclease
LASAGRAFGYPGAMPIRRTSPHARALRRNATEVEKRLWQHLRNRGLGGFKFRNQATVGPYVADFLCAEKGLIVELDGGQHEAERDAARTRRLEQLGYCVIRFWNHEVNDALDGVLQRILTECEERPSRFRPPPPSSKLR